MSQNNKEYKTFLESRKQERENIVNAYIDIALSKLKIAHSFSTQYFNNCVPKNAVHGKVTNNLYVYVDDFQQFHMAHNNKRFIIYVLDRRKDSRFKKTIISKHTEWYNMIFAFIEYHKLYSVKCIPVNCIGRAGVTPERKEPQTKTGYQYKTGVYNQNRVDANCYSCTEADAMRPMVRMGANPHENTDSVRASHKKVVHISQSHYNNYKNMVDAHKTAKTATTATN